MITTAQDNLRHIATQWPALRELLQTRTPSTWPPAGRMADHQRNLDQDDEATELLHQQAQAERAERTALAPGTRPAPLRVSVLDTVTELETELLELADAIASAVQRPAFTTTVRSASPLDEVARSLALMGLKDQQDARRWRFNMATRDGQHAATWLADRLDGEAGPFRPLSDQQRADITAVARTVRRRLDRALGEGERRAPTAWNCACGGQLWIISGTDSDDRLECEKCGTGRTIKAMIDQINPAA